ncbi:MAG: RNA 2',3'-cyclic phosphodiesterase [Acidobacteriia bacterium]|nr:RNA 2',3'-cyclic phosphodiesterase [Terriglobia bacterium]
MRAFIAVDLTREIEAKIAGAQAALGRFSHAVRWVRPESIHLTLKFLGEISNEQQHRVVETFSTRKSGVAPFQISVERLGFFPNARAPRVVWMGIRKGKEELQSLARFVDEALGAAGFPPEPRPFSPHATIGRIKFLPDVASFNEATSAFSDYQCGTTTVHHFFLYESKLDRGGSIYTKRATFGLE